MLVRRAESQAALRAAHAVLDRTRPNAEAQSRCARTLATCLESLDRSSWPAVAWRFSNLNADGDPLEIAFSSHDHALRYTVEVGGPELENGARIDAALDLCARLGHALPEAAIVASWKALQRDVPVKWGAWFGVRENGANERVKFYIEVPAAVRGLTSARGDRLTRDSELQMIGYDCTNGMTEYYYRQPPIVERHLVDDFLRHFKSGTRAEAIGALAELAGRPVRATLGWTSFGYSIARAAHDAEPTVALFARAASLAGGAAIRTAFLDRQRNASMTDTAYARSFAGEPATSLPDHGTVSLIAYNASELEMRVGIAGAQFAKRCTRASGSQRIEQG